MKQAPGGANDLRRRAEAQWAARKTVEVVDELGRAALVQELQIHQIELELQNEELCAARDELRVSLARYTELYDFAPVGHVTVDGDGTIREANLAATKLLEHAGPGPLLGARLGLFVAEHKRGAFHSLLERFFTGAERVSEELEIGLGDASRVLHFEGTRAQQGNQALLALVDVTEIRRSARALALRGAALDAAANTIMITDADGTIEWVNRAFLALTGYTQSECIGKNPRELLKSGVHDAAVYGELWRTILAGETWRGELTNRRKDGTLYLEERTITPVTDGQGNITHFIAVGRDLTEKRFLEAQLVQAQKMEVVGRLAGGIAHDFNNLLTVISGSVDLALTVDREGEPLHENLRAIEKSAQRAALLTRQLLAFSRKQVMSFEAVNLASLVESVAGMVQRLLGLKVKLSVDVQPCGAVAADVLQIEQAILNLAANARDAMPAGGNFTLTVRDVEAEGDLALHGALRPGSYVRLTATDDGSGMDAATCAKIFEPFFTTKGHGSGTGLGLSTVQGIVAQSGGSVRVQSQLGRGTTFEIYLPRIQAVAAERPVPLQPVPVGGHETVLLVDDEDGVRAFAEQVLRRAGYNVITATHGGDALRLFELHGDAVGVVVTDMVMPGIRGTELATELTKRRPGLKILFVSGYADDAFLWSARMRTNESPGDTTAPVEFLSKPYTARQLMAKVRAVLDGPMAPFAVDPTAN